MTTIQVKTIDITGRRLLVYLNSIYSSVTEEVLFMNIEYVYKYSYTLLISKVSARNIIYTTGPCCLNKL